MKLLTYDDSVYRISDKEMDKLNSMLSKLSIEDLEREDQEDEISNYIDSKIESNEYKHVGFIDFSYRR